MSRADNGRRDFPQGENFTPVWPNSKAGTIGFLAGLGRSSNAIADYLDADVLALAGVEDVSPVRCDPGLNHGSPRFHVLFAEGPASLVLWHGASYGEALAVAEDSALRLHAALRNTVGSNVLPFVRRAA